MKDVVSWEGLLGGCLWSEITLEEAFDSNTSPRYNLCIMYLTQLFNMFIYYARYTICSIELNMNLVS